MQSTGIVRSLDDLGRLEIPKELRRIMDMRNNCSLEIFVNNDDEIILKKYSHIRALGVIATQYAEELHKTSGYAVAVCDRDHVVAVGGIPEEELLNHHISADLESAMGEQKTFVFNAGDQRLKPVKSVEWYAIATMPIIDSDKVHGSVMLLSKDTAVCAGETEIKLITIVAALLAKEIED